MRGHGWLTMAFWMGTAAVSAAGQDPLTVVVSDSAGVPDEDMTHAIGMGRRNFAVAGIETSWSVCRPEACAMPREGGYVQVSIVTRMNFSIPGLPPGQVLGWAHQGLRGGWPPIGLCVPQFREEGCRKRQSASFRRARLGDGPRGLAPVGTEARPAGSDARDATKPGPHSRYPGLGVRAHPGEEPSRRCYPPERRGKLAAEWTVKLRSGMSRCRIILGWVL